MYGANFVPSAVRTCTARHFMPSMVMLIRLNLGLVCSTKFVKVYGTGLEIFVCKYFSEFFALLGTGRGNEIEK